MYTSLSLRCRNRRKLKKSKELAIHLPLILLNETVWSIIYVAPLLQSEVVLLMCTKGTIHFHPEYSHSGKGDGDIHAIRLGGHKWMTVVWACTAGFSRGAQGMHTYCLSSHGGMLSKGMAAITNLLIKIDYKQNDLSKHTHASQQSAKSHIITKHHTHPQQKALDGWLHNAQPKWTTKESTHNSRP